MKNLAFVCTTTILYSRPNWYALVKSCINVNHYVLLVRRHLKYVWFTKFTKFSGEVKNGPSLGISKNIKAFSFQLQGGSPPDPPTRGSAPGPRWGLPPDPRAFPQLQICHYTTGGIARTAIARNPCVSWAFLYKLRSTVYCTDGLNSELSSVFTVIWLHAQLNVRKMCVNALVVESLYMGVLSLQA